MERFNLNAVLNAVNGAVKALPGVDSVDIDWERGYDQHRDHATRSITAGPNGTLTLTVGINGGATVVGPEAAER